MSWVHILVAHDSHTYASALAGVLTHLRPEFNVQLVRLDDLDREMSRFPDAIVISDRIHSGVGRTAVGWILYYPDLRDVVVVRVGETERMLTSPDLDDVIAAVDQLASYHATLAARVTEEPSAHCPPIAFGTT